MNKQNQKNQNQSSQRQGGFRGPGGGPGPRGMMAGDKPKNFKRGIGQLFSFLKPHKWLLLTVAVFAAISTVFNIIGPKILMRAIDELQRGLMSQITGGEGGIDFDYIAEIIFILIGLYVISASFMFFQGYIMSGISAKVSYNLRNRIMQKINRLPMSYFNATSHGDVLSRITNDVDTLNNSMNQSITQLITSTISVIGVLIMMLTISWELTLIALGIIPITAILVLTVVKFSQRHFKGQQRYLGSVNGIVEETYGGHLVVKAFNGEEKMLRDFEEENQKLYKAGWKAQFLSGLMMPIMNFVGNIGYVVICLFGAMFAADGRMTIGGIQAFIQYVRSFTQPIAQLAGIFNQIQMTAAASERIFEFLTEEEEAGNRVDYKVNKSEINGDVLFENVVFGYEDSDEIVIKNFNAEIKAGQKIAIVGPTGAGKTTMVKLLMRFHDLKSGAILLDGKSIDRYDRRDIRTAFGMVLQDTWLYNDTILENIRYGRPDATDDQVIEAAKVAQADFFIRTLPDGYDMIINEEATNISQGQKQLLTIARAVLADSKVLILDEATSSVDTRTEILIQRAMDSLMEGRTSFIIAHRLSTIKNADLILCMNEGDIVEQGTHAQLMEAKGFYAELYNSQFEQAG